MLFAAYTLIPLTPLHLGAGRSGIVARTHGHVPGHLLTYAFTAAVARARGARTPEGHEAILDEICQKLRFGPAFVMEGDRRLDDSEVESRFVFSRHHVTLEPASRSAVEGALFETEVLQLSGVVIKGGVWCEEDTWDGLPLKDWFDRLQLGGEWKTGCGRVRCQVFQPHATHYPGVGPVQGEVVTLKAGAILPGAALDGVTEAPLRPWLGRRHDPRLGSGRALSKAALVRLHGRVPEAGCYGIQDREPGLGCWKRRKA
ncbi:MAG: hypothetical protein D6819_08910 [Gammaproteobacteria bacterium]|nr:MAG: hypothetical protein D6819_08910 [Gammaproteobacteria bacterium]